MRDILIPQMVEIIDNECSKYRLDEKLGEGGIGSVYKAHKLGYTPNICCVKLIIRGDLTRFNESIRAMETLPAHPNIQSYQCSEAIIVPFQIDNTQYRAPCYVVITNYLEGRLLTPEILGPIYSLEYIRNLTRVLLNTLLLLETLETHGIVHRDIKRQNLLLSQSKEVLLLDFDMAMTAGKRTRHTVGSLPYLPPEAFLREHTEDTRFDIYQLGMMGAGFLFGFQEFLKLAEEWYWDKVLNVPESHDKKVILTLDSLDKESFEKKEDGLAGAVYNLIVIIKKMVIGKLDKRIKLPELKGQLTEFLNTIN
ncbi:hypothetical protein A2272_04360 [Candidatus Peregrinibacteria bacterium RIFOXYA12_FULL_33_12]|nr:MAG: hypothetical protein A2272_04360 [Candidatus Peregrinibacteria bacterium RIFOXYA12_FULL_33_12]OGJ51098.1 MAG: hypothetical protein A2307_06505 [Candidatus Peregrinibacteria bacterium RIFOXYB2_FULL_33_20]